MSPIWVIARTEFMDVLRDRRTLVFMLLRPIVVMPLVMIAFSRVTKSQLRAKESRRLTVAIDKGGEQILRSLGRRWSQENMLPLIALGGRLMLSVGEFDFDDLERMVERVDTYKEAGEATRLDDAALMSGLVAYRSFTDREKQLLEDAAAVHAVLSRTDWRDIGRLARQPAAKLPPGVEPPRDLPAGLDSPAVTAAIVGEAKELHAALHVPVEIFDRLEEQA
ncbi:MAG TPA: hypothetical protein VFD43_01165, partial [Planctomycetota bacterium]|nr:hypothetical protein [Planctomycetota bacterium]